MKYLSAYLLCSLGGNENPGFDNIQSVLSSVGLDVDAENAHLVVNALKGKNMEEVIAAGQKKLASVPCGGGVPASATIPDSAKPAASTPAVDKKEEKKEESEDDEDMGFGLFD